MTMKKEVRIKVAEQVIGLKIDEGYRPSFIKVIHEAYKIFLTEDKPSLFIDIDLSNDAPPKYFPFSRLNFKDSIITIEDDCLLGSLDLTKRYGKIKLNPINPLYPLGTFLRNACTLLVVLEDKGIVLHAVGVLKDEEVYIFIGPSGAGKTTVANLSLDKVILSDDMVMIKKVEGEFRVFPTPAWGDYQSGYRENRPYRINSMFKLIKDKTVYLEKFSPAYTLGDIFTIPHIPAEFIPFDKLLARFSEAISTIPYYGLHFLPEPSFWTCIEEGCNLWRKKGERQLNPTGLLQE